MYTSKQSESLRMSHHYPVISEMLREELDVETLRKEVKSRVKQGRKQ